MIEKCSGRGDSRARSPLSLPSKKRRWRTIPKGYEEVRQSVALALGQDALGLVAAARPHEGTAAFCSLTDSSRLAEDEETPPGAGPRRWQCHVNTGTKQNREGHSGTEDAHQ